MNDVISASTVYEDSIASKFYVVNRYLKKTEDFFEFAICFCRLKEKFLSAGMEFAEAFPVLLTDNGGEFSNVSAFENDLNGCAKTRMFFCDPNAPYQKPHVENNHTLFRGIAQKGTSFDSFTQDHVNLIFSHINAVKRKQFNGKSAYDMFTFTYSKELADLLGISFVPAKNVIQTPKLLKLFS